MVYITKLIELERNVPSWDELETKELLFVLGEKTTEENIVNMNLARELL
jgi:hypothetical protein